MDDRILIISDNREDLDLFNEILGPRGFDLEKISLFYEVENTLPKDEFAAVLVDYDLSGDRAYEWIELLQQNSSKSCLILYGEKARAEKISELLEKGAYGFVPRALLSERIYDTVVGGLENRRAFIGILGMIDELRTVNETLKKEKEALGTKNEELDFIGQLSREVAYDLSWDRILPRILDAGLLRVITPELLGIFYRLGSKWNLAIYLSAEEVSEKGIEILKEELVERFLSLSREKIATEKIILQLYPSTVKISSASTFSFSGAFVVPLTLAGKPLGMLLILPRIGEDFDNEKTELISTISNILAISLKNAQEYHKLKEMAVTDGLTGTLNYKGLRDFIGRELRRARRYNKSLSLVMIDVDGFKAINDSLGHLAGDYVLRELAACLKRSLRNTDIVARYGGDEFAIILPETELEKAEVLVKRMIHAIKHHDFEWGPERIDVDISYGISANDELENSKSDEELIQRADTRLYEAKRSRSLSYPVSGNR